MKYIDTERLRKEVKRLEKAAHKSALGCPDSETRKFHEGKDFAYQSVGILIDSLQQELDSRSIPVLRADTTEKQDRILEIIGQDEIYCHFSLDSGKETDCGYEDYNDRVYIDGDLTFNKMAEIVDFLSKNSK